MYIHMHNKNNYKLYKMLFLVYTCIYTVTLGTMFHTLLCIYACMPTQHLKLGFKSITIICPVYIALRYHIYKGFNYTLNTFVHSYK